MAKCLHEARARGTRVLIRLTISIAMFRLRISVTKRRRREKKKKHSYEYFFLDGLWRVPLQQCFVFLLEQFGLEFHDELQEVWVFEIALTEIF